MTNIHIEHRSHNTFYAHLMAESYLAVPRDNYRDANAQSLGRSGAKKAYYLSETGILGKFNYALIQNEIENNTFIRL